MPAKTAFSENPMTGYQMGISDFAKAAQFYSEKHAISIVWNGTGLSQQRDAIEQRLNALRNPEEKYHAFLSMRYVKDLNRDLKHATRLSNALSVTDAPRAFVNYFSERTLYRRLQAMLSPFLDDNGDFIKDLSCDQKARLNLQINASENTTIKEELDALIQTEIALFPFSGTPMSHSDNDYLKEMRFLSKTLTDGQYLGYLFTDNAYTKTHYEVFIIGENEKIIRPVAWPIADNLEMENALLQHSHYFTPPVFYKDSHTMLCAQVDKSSCGTLGLLYLKKLLKDNAEGLKQSLQFHYYTAAHVRKGMFVASATILHYSQSKKYIEAFRAFVLSDDATFSIPDPKKKTHPLLMRKNQTLKGLLDSSLKIARARYDLKTAEEIEGVLERLPEFRREWSLRYAEEIQKHAVMQTAQGNQTLAFKTHQLHLKAMKPGEIVGRMASQRDLVTPSYAAFFGVKKLREVKAVLSHSMGYDPVTVSLFQKLKRLAPEVFLEGRCDIVPAFFTTFKPGAFSFWKKIKIDDVTVMQIIDHALGKNTNTKGKTGEKTRAALIACDVDLQLIGNAATSDEVKEKHIFDKIKAYLQSKADLEFLTAVQCVRKS